MSFPKISNNIIPMHILAPKDYESFIVTRVNNQSEVQSYDAARMFNICYIQCILLNSDINITTHRTRAGLHIHTRQQNIELHLFSGAAVVLKYSFISIFLTTFNFRAKCIFYFFSKYNFSQFNIRKFLASSDFM